MPNSTCVFAVKDDKADVYVMPFFARDRHEAIRIFTTAARNENTNISMFPADFTLYQLSEIDLDSGHVVDSVDHGGPEKIINAFDLVGAPAKAA